MVNHPNCWSEKNSRKYNVIKGRLPILQVFVKAHLIMSLTMSIGLNFVVDKSATHSKESSEFQYLQFNQFLRVYM